MPNPNAFKNQREAEEYLAALEHQNEVLTGRLSTLETSANELSIALQDKETRLVQMSQALGEKEQLVATILANEDALSEALAMRDERVALLEETLQSLKVRANQAMELQDEHQRLTHHYQELKLELEPTQKALVDERTKRENLAAACKELQTQREQLDAALADANAALIDMDGQIADLAHSQASDQHSYEQLSHAHQNLTQQYERQKTAYQQTSCQLDELAQKRDETCRELQEARASLTALQAQYQQAAIDLSTLATTQATEHAHWEAEETAHAELNQEYQHLAASSRALQEDLSALSEQNATLESRLAAEGQRMATLTGRYEELEHRYSTQSIALKEAEGRLEAFVHARLAQEEEWDHQQQSHAELLTTFAILTKEHETFKEQLLDADTKNQDLLLDLAECRKARAQEAAQWEEEQAAHCELVEAYQLLSNRFYDQEGMLATLTGDMEHIQAQKSERLAHQHELIESLNELTTQHEALKARLLTANTHCQDLAVELSSAKEALGKCAVEQEHEANAHHALVDAYQSLSDRFYDQELALSAATTQLETLAAIRSQELAQWEVQESAHAELVQAYADLARSYQQTASDLAAIKEERIGLIESLAQAQRDRALEDAHWDLQEQAHTELITAYRELSNQCSVQEEALATLSVSLDSTSTELATVQQELADQTTQMHGRIHEHTTLVEQYQALVLINHSLENQLEDLAQLSRDRDGSVIAARSEATQLRSQLEELSRSWQVLDDQRQELVGQLTHLHNVEDLLTDAQQTLKKRDATIAQLTATSCDQQTALSSLERTRDSLTKELADLKAFQGALLQWEVEKLANARSPSPQAKRTNSSRRERAIATRIHIVSPGETLSTIAQEYNKSIQDLYNANSDAIPNQNQVRIGTALVIP